MAQHNARGPGDGSAEPPSEAQKFSHDDREAPSTPAPQQSKPHTQNGDLANLAPGLASAIAHLPIFVLWKWAWDEAKSKWDKPPFKARSPDSHASSTKPSTWAPYQVALEAYQRGEADGINIALTLDAAPNVIAFDLDKCRNSKGELKAWAMHIIARAHELKAYVEVSAGGAGYHIFGLSDCAPVRKEKYPVPDGGSVEVFHQSNGHFLSVTGNQLGECSDPLPDLSEFFDEVVESLGDGVSLRGARVKATGDTTPSGVFHKFVWSRASRGRTYDEVVEDVRAHPDNIGERYEEQN